MYFIELGSAKQVLDRRMPALVKALSDAVAIWDIALAGSSGTLGQFSRGVIIHEAWYELVQRAFHYVPEVTVEANAQRNCVRVADQLILRLKHAGKYYKPWNYPTARARAWTAQRPFETIPPLPRVDLAYKLDVTGTVLVTAMLLLHDGNNALWRYQVSGQRLTEFVRPRDMFGRKVYDYSDFSKGSR